MIAQFTEHTSAVKIRGKALIQTSNGEIATNNKSSIIYHLFLSVRM